MRAALRLAEVYGGQEGCDIPRAPSAQHPWVQVIGWEAMLALCAHYGGDRIHVPRNAAANSLKVRIHKMKAAGLSHPT